MIVMQILLKPKAFDALRADPHRGRALSALRGPFKRLLRRLSTQARGVDHVAPRRVVSVTVDAGA